jgi:ATP-binding cassette subfamily B protein
MQKVIGSTEQRVETPIPTSLRALAAVAARLGVDASVDQMRRRFALQPGEPDTPTLIALARELGLEAQALHMKFEDLPQLGKALPAILRARDGGALILEDARSDPTKGTVAVIRDPSANEDAVVAIDELHLAEVWEGEAILIKRIHSVTDEQQPFGLAWIARQVLKERKLFGDIAAGAPSVRCLLSRRPLFS